MVYSLATVSSRKSYQQTLSKSWLVKKLLTAPTPLIQLSALWMHRLPIPHSSHLSQSLMN
jgi:hypothetical protein